MQKLFHQTRVSIKKRQNGLYLQTVVQFFVSFFLSAYLVVLAMSVDHPVLSISADFQLEGGDVINLLSFLWDGALSGDSRQNLQRMEVHLFVGKEDFLYWSAWMIWTPKCRTEWYGQKKIKHKTKSLVWQQKATTKTRNVARGKLSVETMKQTTKNIKGN